MVPIRVTQVNFPPGMINFGSGQPGPDLLPLALLRTAAANRLDDNDASFLAYGAEHGNGYFRMTLARFLSQHYQLPVDGDDLFVTAGASQGLDLICTLFTRPGDIIFVEEPTYFLALRIFADHGLSIVSLPMDDHGLNVEALEEQLSQNTPVFLYTVPTFHNPSSVTLAAQRRRQLVQLSQKHNFLIVADEVYHLLAYNAEPPPPLASFCETDSVLSLGSFSKIMAPGLRLGWIQTGKKLMRRLTGCGMLESGGGLNPFTSAVVCSAIKLGLQKEHLQSLKDVYSQRRIALIKALRTNLPAAVSFAEPGGGYFFWLRFPDGIDTEKLLRQARRQNVGFLPGLKFSSRNGLRNYARLSLSYFDTPQLEEGARRLAAVTRRYMEGARPV